MKKRHRHEEHFNHEAWVIPYADLLTLLLAFFVVLYATSVINVGKYRLLSESIIQAFNGSSKVISPIEPTPDPSTSTSGQGIPLPRAVTPTSSSPSSLPRDRLSLPRGSGEQENLVRIQDEVQRALQPLIDKKLVTVRRTQSWLEIEIRTDILFPSGVARLSDQAQDVLQKLAGILAGFPNPMRVEGYTDDKPINTAVFPSNWELSAARAASVVRLFADRGVDPNRLGIIGWGQYRPVADNASEDGRNRNRRVLVVVLSDRAAPSRFYSDADRLAHEAAAGQPAGGAPAPAAPPSVAPAPPAVAPPPPAIKP
jgi:chemotaxis protein MotB